jgi:hypothetical protein
VQIIGHDNAIIAGAEHPWGAGLEIDLPHLAADSGQRRRRRDVAIDHANRKAGLEQKPGVPSAARGEIEHPAAASDQWRESSHPGRGWCGGHPKLTVYHHIGIHLDSPDGPVYNCRLGGWPR